MSTRNSGLILLGLVIVASGFGQTEKNPLPPTSHLNGIWMIANEMPKFYFIGSFSWGKAKVLGESSMIIDLGTKDVGGKGYVFVPGGGGWKVLQILPQGESQVQLSTESLDSGPAGHMRLTLVFHFLNPNKFWLELSHDMGINTGQKHPWYRLSGPGDPVPPPPPKRTEEE